MVALTAAQALGHRREVRSHPEILLGAASGEPETGDDLVENQQRPVLRGQLPE